MTEKFDGESDVRITDLDSIKLKELFGELRSIQRRVLDAMDDRMNESVQRSINILDSFKKKRNMSGQIPGEDLLLQSELILNDSLRKELKEESDKRNSYTNVISGVKEYRDSTEDVEEAWRFISSLKRIFSILPRVVIVDESLVADIRALPVWQGYQE